MHACNIQTQHGRDGQAWLFLGCRKGARFNKMFNKFGVRDEDDKERHVIHAHAWVSSTPSTHPMFTGTADVSRTAYMSRVGQNHIFTVYIRYFWQGKHQIYGLIGCVYTVLANPMHETCLCLRVCFLAPSAHPMFTGAYKYITHRKHETFLCLCVCSLAPLLTQCIQASMRACKHNIKHTQHT